MTGDAIGQRVKSLSHLRPDQLSETPPPPQSAKIELTSRCNFKCNFCAHTQGLRKGADMDRGLYTRVISELYDAGVRSLGVFFLGESFLVPWLPEAIAEAKATGYPRVFLTTNGALCKPEIVEQCMAAGLDSLKFSLNYATPDQMTEIAGVKASLFDRITDNVRAAHAVREEGGYGCHLAGSYIAYDGDQAALMAARIDELRPYLDECYQLPLYNQAGQVEHDASRLRNAGNPGHVSAPVAAVPCWVLFSQAHVLVDGTMTACCFDHGGRFDMGSLADTPFHEIWTSEAFRELRRAHLNNDVHGTPCEKCIYGR